jgi:hypothetical protein
LIKTNGNTNEIFLLVNYSEFYWWKYSLSIYQGNYGGKKKLKQSQKIRWHVIYTNGIIEGINSVGKIIGKVFTSPDTVHHVNYKGSAGIVHFSIAFLIIVLYRQNH